MGARIRSYPWAETTLGVPDSWPQGLRTALRILLTTQHPIFIFWGPELICFYNDAYSRSLGPEQHPSMLGKPARTQWPLIWDVIGPQIAQVMSGGGATWHENQKLKILRHGELQDIYWTYSYGPIDEQTAPGNVGGVLVICTETTQQVLSEQRMAMERERFAQLFQQAPSFMCVLRGPEHIVEMTNPAYLQLIGGRHIVGKRLADAMPEAAEQGYVKLLDQVYATGKAFTATGATFSSRSAPDTPVVQRYLDFVYQPIVDPDGRVGGIFVEGFDASDRVTAERALRDANRRKDEFLAMLAHELRNPLSPIRNAAHILSRQLRDDAQAQEPIAMMQRQVLHLTRLVDDLLDVSRISQGRIELRREDLLLSEVLDQALETVAPMAREKKQHIRVECDIEAVWVNADRARLVQTFVNVLTNAVKYTHAGGNVRVKTHPEEQSVSVEIADDGPGIAPEVLPHIFELFVQSERTLDRAQGGLGIGLSVVRKLVEMQGGEVFARSEGLGKGATFTVRLPRGQAPHAQIPETPRVNQARHRVLVVDDNIDAANSLAQLLEFDGHETRTAFTSHVALDVFDTFAPSVVLLDIGLPEMDGYEVAQRLRQRGQHRTLLVALTGYGQREDQERAIRAGFDKHLVKPVDFDELQRVLEAA